MSGAVLLVPAASPMLNTRSGGKQSKQEVSRYQMNVNCRKEPSSCRRLPVLEMLGQNDHIPLGRGGLHELRCFCMKPPIHLNPCGLRVCEEMATHQLSGGGRVIDAADYQIAWKRDRICTAPIVLLFSVPKIGLSCH